MKISSLEPMQAVPAQDNIEKPENLQARTVEPIQEIEKEGQRDPSDKEETGEGFLRFLNFLQKKKKSLQKAKTPKSKKECALACYQEVSSWNYESEEPETDEPFKKIA